MILFCRFVSVWTSNNRNEIGELTFKPNYDFVMNRVRWEFFKMAE